MLLFYFNQIHTQIEKAGKFTGIYLYHIQAVFLLLSFPQALKNLRKKTEKKSSPYFQSHNFLKFIGILFTIVDHYGLYLNNNFWFRCLGRIPFPLLAFLLGFEANICVSFDLWFFSLLLVLWNWKNQFNNLVTILPTFLISKLFLQVFVFLKLPQLFESPNRNRKKLFVLMMFGALMNFAFSKLVRLDYAFLSMLFAVYGLYRKENVGKQRNKRFELIFLLYVSLNYLANSTWFIKSFDSVQLAVFFLIYLLDLLVLVFYRNFNAEKNIFFELVSWLGSKSVVWYTIGEFYFQQELTKILIIHFFSKNVNKSI